MGYVKNSNAFWFGWGDRQFYSVPSVAEFYQDLFLYVQCQNAAISITFYKKNVNGSFTALTSTANNTTMTYTSGTRFFGGGLQQTLTHLQVITYSPVEWGPAALSNQNISISQLMNTLSPDWVSNGIDGVSLVTSDRILFTGQTGGVNNGIWEVSNTSLQT